jgi:hypothetical protein
MVQLDECVDDRGQSLLLDDARKFPSKGEFRYWNWTVPVEFKAPAPGRSVKTLKGRFNVALTMDQRYLVFTNFMQAAGRSLEFDGLRLTIVKATWLDDWNEVRFEVSAPAGSPYGSLLTNSPGIVNVSVSGEAREAIRIYDKESWWVPERLNIYEELRGRATAPHPQAACEPREVRHDADRDVLPCTLYFAKGLKPATLIWLSPSETRWSSVSFELHDLALP